MACYGWNETDGADGGRWLENSVSSWALYASKRDAKEERGIKIGRGFDIAQP